MAASAVGVLLVIHQMWTPERSGAMGKHPHRTNLSLLLAPHIAVCGQRHGYSGYSERLWHCGLRHASQGLHQRVWRSTMETSGDRFSVRSNAGKTPMNLVILIVVDRRNSHIVRRWESNRVQHRKLRPRGCRHQTEGSAIHWISKAEGKYVEDTMLDLLKPFTAGSKGRVASSSTRTDRGDPKHEVVKPKSLDEKLPSVVTDAGRGDTLA